MGGTHYRYFPILWTLLPNNSHTICTQVRTGLFLRGLSRRISKARSPESPQALLVTGRKRSAVQLRGRETGAGMLAHHDAIMVLAVKSPATFIFCVELMILEPGDKYKLICLVANLGLFWYDTMFTLTERDKMESFPSPPAPAGMEDRQNSSSVVFGDLVSEQQRETDSRETRRLSSPRVPSKASEGN